MATPLSPKAPILAAWPSNTPPAQPNPFESGAPAPVLDGGHDVEACANAILGLLPKPVAEYAREMAYVYNRQPLWALVAGHVLKSYENGDLQAPLLDPSWPRQFTNLPADPTQSVAECEWRGGEKGTHTYTRRRYRQKFCSNECGAAAAMAPKAATG